MTKTMNVMVFVIIAVAAASTMLQRIQAAEYLVGDQLGWTIPPRGAPSYAEWASKYSFVVDDLIVFDFVVGEQNLALNLAFVTKKNFLKCNTTDPLFVRKDPVKIKFEVSSTYYFTSTFAWHCKKGQKVAIHIGPSSSSTISSTSSPSPSPSAASEAPGQTLPLEFLPL